MGAISRWRNSSRAVDGKIVRTWRRNSGLRWAGRRLGREFIHGVGDVVRRSPPSAENALTRVWSTTYHDRMTQRRRIAIGSVLLSGILAMASGCEDAAKKTAVRAPVPAAALKQANPP